MPGHDKEGTVGVVKYVFQSPELLVHRIESLEHVTVPI